MSREELESQPLPPVSDGPVYRWYHRLFALAFALFCFEVGVVLLCLPWSPFWEQNYFAGFPQPWMSLWKNMYLRGAVSGLGIVNIYIAIAELSRLRLFRR